MGKKLQKFAGILLLTALLCSCAGTTPDPAPTDPLTLAMTNKLQSSAVRSLPVAHAGMTKEELRQLCIDYFTLQLSFQWTPGADVKHYPHTHYQFDIPRTLDTGSVYGGIPYQSLGTGNLYRWLEYYDERTGVFDIARAKAENGGDLMTHVEKDKNGNITYGRYRWMRVMFNQCSVASFWGWGRVINSATFLWTSQMNVYNGFIPVGGYTYGYTHNGNYYGQETIQNFGEVNAAWNPLGYDTEDVIEDWKAAQGQDAMFRCYAQMQPADCLVSGGHAMMVKSVDLFYNEDGSINYRRSTVTVLEQIENWGTESTLNDGKIPYKIQGETGSVYSFATLQNKEYIPFTFAEFLEADDPRLENYTPSTAIPYSAFPQGREHSGAGVEAGELYQSASLGEAIRFSELQTLTVGANYPISDVFVTVTDGEGQTVLRNIYRADRADCREVSMSDIRATWETVGGKTLRLYDGIQTYCDGGHTVCVTVQLSNGQLLEALRGTLIP